jgi:hypothetical protein
MLKQLILIAAATALFVGTAQADIIIVLDPPNGALFGNPGGTVGWGFSITPDPSDFATIDSVQLAFDSNPALGVFTDFLGPQGGPNQGFIPPASGNWTQSFDLASGQGLGSYQISSSAQIGDRDTGRLAVFYDLYSADPSVCPSCYIQTNENDISFSVTATPEPGSALLLVAGLAGFCLLRMKA